MQTVYLQKVEQNGHIFYTGICDPRLLIQMTSLYKADIAQPDDLNKEHMNEVVDYVIGPGTVGVLPFSIILGACRSNIPALKEMTLRDGTRSIKMYAMDLPETPEEQSKYRNIFYVIDGKHRMAAFSERYCHLPQDVTYQMNFSIFFYPTLDEQREIVKREIAKNAECPLYSVVLSLMRGALSPLRESLENTTHEGTLYNALRHIEADKLHGVYGSEKRLYRILVTYFDAWGTMYESTGESKNSNELFASINRVSYMLLFLPVTWEYCCAQKIFSQEFFIHTLAKIPKAIDERNVALTDIFDMPHYYREDVSIHTAAHMAEPIIEGLHSLLCVRNPQNTTPSDWDPFAGDPELFKIYNAWYGF